MGKELVEGLECSDILTPQPDSPVDTKVVVSNSALLSWDARAVGNNAAWFGEGSACDGRCVGPCNAAVAHMVSGMAFAWKVDVKWKGKALRLCFFSS